MKKLWTRLGSLPYLLYLALLAPVGFLFWLMPQDAGRILIWHLALSIPGWLVWPAVCRLFPDGDGGYLLAKAIGLAIPAWIVWTLSFLHLLPFARWAIIAVLLLVGAAAWAWRRGYQTAWDFLRRPSGSRHLVAGELFILSALILWSFARGLKPELDSLEKFMDLGLMNSLYRSRYLPAPDMWFAGSNINYYYFGQFVYTYLAKLTGIRPEIAYNLGMATTFAMTAALAYTAGSRLFLLLRQDIRACAPAWATVSGLAASALVTVAGNGHAFLYADGSPGKKLLDWALRRGWVGGTADKAYWFADATRYIGYNPDTTDKTIHEFPFYSFLVADLHAHVINLTFVLVLVILMTALIRRSRLQRSAAACREIQDQLTGSDDTTWHRQELRSAWQRLKDVAGDGLVGLIALLLSIFMMGNYWDFAIYLAVAALVLLLVNLNGYGARIRPSGVITLLMQFGLLLVPYLAISHPAVALLGFAAVLAVNSYLTVICGDALTLTGAQVSWLFFLSHVLALPFNLSFEPIAKSIARTVQSTPLWQLLVLWGPHLAAGFLFLAVLVALHLRPPVRRFPPPPDIVRNETRPLARFLQPFAAADKLAVVLLVWGTALIALPELVYVVDIYSGDYKRANTMFKFTYQAFVLLSLVWGYAIVRLASLPQRSTLRLTAAVLALMLVIPAWYPGIAARQWLGRFTPDRYQGLDGSAILDNKDSSQIPGQANGELAPDAAAIRWFNETVDGHPVILETFGESYTDYGRISAFTGLPTVMGWETHEWLWRTSKANPNAYASFVLPRQNDVTTLYTTKNQAERRALIEQYQIAYIVIGDLERGRFRSDPQQENSPSLVQEDLLAELGTVVFSQGSLVVIAVN